MATVNEIQAFSDQFNEKTWLMLSWIFNSFHFSRKFFLSILFILRSSFLLRIPTLIRVLSIKNSGCFQVRFLAINDVILTSLLLLETIYVLANFLTPYHLRFFRLMSILRETWILPINSTIWRHDDVILRLCVNQVIPTTTGVATFSTSCMPALSMPF